MVANACGRYAIGARQIWTMSSLSPIMLHSVNIHSVGSTKKVRSCLQLSSDRMQNTAAACDFKETCRVAHSGPAPAQPATEVRNKGRDRWPDQRTVRSTWALPKVWQVCSQYQFSSLNRNGKTALILELGVTLD